MPDEEPARASDKAKAFAYDLGIGGMNIGGGVLDAVNKQFDVLIDLTKGLMSGNPMGFGGTVANAVVDGYNSLKPIKDGIATSLGINEKNGQIDPEAAGTLRGAQYYQQQRRLGKFNENVNAWLKDSMARSAGMKGRADGVDSANIMEYMNKMTPRQLQIFANRYNQMVEGEKQRLYAKARNGQLDKMDQAMLSAYTDIGKKLSTAAQQSAREHNLHAAQLRTMGTQARAKVDADRIKFNDILNQMNAEANEGGANNPDLRRQVIYNVMEPKIRQARGTGRQYIVKDPDTGDWKMNESILTPQDWERIRADLEGRWENNGHRWNPGEEALYNEISMKLDRRNLNRTNMRQQNLKQLGAVKPPANNPTEKKKTRTKVEPKGTGKKNPKNTKKKTPEEVESTSKSAMIDAEGLTFGELFHIVKAKMPEMSDQEAEDFTNDTFYNVGEIESKDDLYNEMKNTSEGSDKGFLTPGGTGRPTNTDFDSKPSQYFDPDLVAPYLRSRGHAWWTKNYGDTAQPTQNDRFKNKDKRKPKAQQKPLDVSPEVSDVIGRTRNETNQRKKLATNVKRWMDEQGITEGTHLSREQREHIRPLDEEFVRLTGKHLWEDDALRGPQAATLREMYYRNENYGDMADQMASRYFPDTDGEKRQGYSDLIYDMLGRGISLDEDALLMNRSGRPHSREDHFRDNYLKMYNNFQSYADRYIDDPEITDALKTIWRNYTADAIERMGSSRGRESDDKDDSIFLRELGRKVVDDLRLEDRKNDFHTPEQAKEIVNRAVRRRLQQLRTGEYAPKTPIGGRGYLSDTLGEIEEYGNAQIERLRYDKKRKDKGKELLKMMNKYRLPADRLLGMSPNGARQSVKAWAIKNMSKAQIATAYGQLKGLWDSVNRSISYEGLNNKYGTDKDFMQSTKEWKEYQKLISNILDGLNKAMNSKLDEDIIEPEEGASEKVPSASRNGRANRSSKNVLLGSNYLVENVEYKDGEPVTDENGKRFIETTLMPILDRYKSTKKVDTSIMGYLRNMDTETLQTMKAWLMANIKRGKAYDAYAKDRKAYRKEWESKGLPEPGTVVHYGGHTRFLPMFEDVLKVISNEIKARKV